MLLSGAEIRHLRWSPVLAKFAFSRLTITCSSGEESPRSSPIKRTYVWLPKRATRLGSPAGVRVSGLCAGPVEARRQVRFSHGHAPLRYFLGSAASLVRCNTSSERNRSKMLRVFCHKSHAIDSFHQHRQSSLGADRDSTPSNRATDPKTASCGCPASALGIDLASALAC